MSLPPFDLERYFAPYEFTAEYLLCSSDCESMTVGDLFALEPGAAERFQRLWLGYTQTQGDPALRREIVRIYTSIQPDQALVHSGAEEAIFVFMHAALSAGDHVIVHTPCYQSLGEIARGLGCEVTPWRADPENHWRLDLDELKRLTRPETKVIVVNMPHNPTGYLMTQEEARALYAFADERGIIIFSDEVYRELEYDPARRLPAGCDLSERAVSLGVVSKTYGLAGLRIGWVATRNRALYRRMEEIKDYTTICNSAPSEFMAEVALRHRERLARRNLDLIRDNLPVLDAFFARHTDRFEWRRPEAGPIAFPKLIDGDIAVFCHELVTKAGVLLLPGTLYRDAGNHFRVGFARRNLPEAVERLERFLTEG